MRDQKPYAGKVVVVVVVVGGVVGGGVVVVLVVVVTCVAVIRVTEINTIVASFEPILTLFCRSQEVYALT